MFRYKTRLGPKLRVRAFVTQKTEARIACSGIVPPKYSNASVIIEVDRILSAPLLDVAKPTHHAWCPRLAVPNLSSAPAGEPGFAATTRRVAALGSQTAEVDVRRSNLLGVAAVCGPIGNPLC